ncbi:restriction endonuclease subunit S [Burkholderia sp. 22313]|uniref:restriction endonuclease subunit S n=1 Tax=Burkholderia sp. 22313 TaxID=3453908 RepID=UPI003F848647
MNSRNQFTLGELCEIQRGGSPRPIDQYITDSENGVNWIKIGDVAEGEKYIYTTKEKIKPEGANRSRHVAAGDFLLTNSMSFGRPYILRTSGCIHDGWLVLRYDKARLDEDYLYRVLSSDLVYAQFVKLAAGAVVKNLNSDVVKQVTIPVPSIEEQRRIAAILDKADALRAKRREALALLGGMAQAIFVDMFGSPVRNPKNWPTAKLGEVGTLDRGVSKHRPRNAPKLLGGPYPLVQTGDVANSGGYVESFSGTYSEEGLRQSRLWRAGTLCITIAANIAKTGILTFDACFPDSVVGFVANDRATIEYVRVWLSFLQKTLEENAPEVAQKNINLAILRDLDIPLPPIEHRMRFLAALDVVNAMSRRGREAYAYTDKLFKSLQSDVFHGKRISEQLHLPSTRVVLPA